MSYLKNYIIFSANQNYNNIDYAMHRSIENKTPVSHIKNSINQFHNQLQCLSHQQYYIFE
jgi:hypothetical protein